MNNSSCSRICRRLWQIALVFVLGVSAASNARAGFNLELDLVLEDGTYSFSPYLTTNSASPAVPYGDYFVASPGWPTNGASVLYHNDSTGFNQVASGTYGFSDFDAPDFNDSFIQNITNGLWSIFVTNTAVTNVYHFSVTSSITSNTMPPVVLIYPPNNALNVSNQPNFVWQGPTNYDDLILYQDAENTYLPVTQTNYSQFTPDVGTDGFNVHYDLYSSNALVSSVPIDSASQPLSSWVSTVHFQDLASCQFTVGGPSIDFNAVLSTTNLPWAATGDTAWFSETTNTYDSDPTAAESGGITNYEASTLSVVVKGPGTLTYYWSTIANDPNSGFSLEFDVDGNYSNNITGDTDWYQDGPYSISPGWHTLSWTTYANGDTDSTEAGFLDLVSYATAPAATLTVSESPSSGTTPLAVQFTSPGTDSFGSAITSWTWSFGDGSSATNQSPSHTYTNAGSYSPSLIAYSSSQASPISVDGLSTITVTNATLNVTVVPQSGIAPLTVQFASPGEDSSGHEVTNRNWNFGDGTTSPAQSPTHIYTNAGEYSPTLVAYSTYGTSPLAITGLGVVSVSSNTFAAFRTLYTFDSTLGSGPNGGLVVSGSTLYGTTRSGGTSNDGALFAIGTDASHFTNLFNFDSTSGWGANELTLSGGTLYGPTDFGGALSGGTVFAISTNGTGYTNLYNLDFNVDPNSPASPQAPLVLAESSLYGATWYGGSYDHGTLYTVATNGSSSGILHSFYTPSYNPYANNYDGIFPSARLLYAGGVLYGTAENGGESGGGAVFSVAPNNPGSFTILHYFSTPVDGTNYDGAYSFSDLVLSGTNLYGTTFGGGAYGNGTIFAVSTNGAFFTNIYSFPGGSEGSEPHGGLTLSGTTLYGTTLSGGVYTNGTIFSIDIDGSGYSTLYSFTGGNDGASPQADLTVSGNTLYGATAAGGSAGNGTIFGFTLETPPALAITRSGTNVILTWPASASGYELEYTTNLSSPTFWNTNLPTPLIINGSNTVTNSITALPRFYRLHR